MGAETWWWVLLVLVIVIVAAVVASNHAAAAAVVGGSIAARRRTGPPPSPHVVVDTLNLVGWLGKRPSVDAVVAAVDRTAAAVTRRFRGRVFYVLKDRDSAPVTEADRRRLHEAAERNRVWIVVAERYPDDHAAALPAAHAARGRDDFYVSLLAHQYRCPVLTNDRLRDFAEFREAIPPFQTTEYTYWRATPHRDWVRPQSTAYARVRRPRLIRFEDIDLKLQSESDNQR